MKNTLLLLFLFVSTYIVGQEMEIHENILENKTYIDRIAFFVANPLEKGQIVFLGNSLTQGGKWEQYFPNQVPANRGLAGDNTLGMLGRLHEVIEAKPSKVFLLAGINDISLSRPTDKIMTNIKAIIYQLQEGSPNTKIYVQSLLPINNDAKRYKRLIGKEKQVKKLNRQLKQFCEKEGITFLDIYPVFLFGKDKLDAKYTTDGLHLNDSGYALWVEQIRKYVEEP